MTVAGRARYAMGIGACLAWLDGLGTLEAQKVLECDVPTVEGCLDQYTHWNKKWELKEELRDYLLAHRFATWKTSDECGVDQSYINAAKWGTGNMLALAAMDSNAWYPEPIYWATFRKPWTDKYDGFHIRGLTVPVGEGEAPRESHLVLIKKNRDSWKTLVHEGGHHGGIKESEENGKKLDKVAADCVERDEQKEDSVKDEWDEMEKKGGSGGLPIPGTVVGIGTKPGGGKIRVICTAVLRRECNCYNDPPRCECFHWVETECRILAGLFEELGLRLAGLAGHCPSIPVPLPLPGERPAWIAAIDRPRGLESLLPVGP